MDGTLYAWGFNARGELGIGTTTPTSTHIKQKVGTAHDWAQVIAGNIFTLAIKKNGELWAWGSGGFGALGNGSSSDRYLPTRVK